MVVLTGLLMPGVSAMDPRWTWAGPPSGELSCVVISADGSTIVAGGDQLIALSRDGRKLWSGWSGSHLAISRDGNYIVTSRDQTVRMISGTGTMLWDTSLGVPVTDLSMTPDAALIAASGGDRVRVINGTGDGFRQNTSVLVRHVRLFPDGNRLVITTPTGIQTSNLTLFSEWTDTNVTQDYVEVAADGSSYVTVTNNRVRFYNRSGTLLWDRALPGGNALDFAYSRDGSTIVVGRDDNTIEVLDRDGTLLWTERASYWVTSVAVSDDGNTIAAGSFDKSLSVYTRAGTKLGSSTASNPIKSHSVAVSGDGSVIVAVDGSAVYGFSRSQFTVPVTSGVTMVETPVAVATTGPPLLPVITTPQPVPSRTATTQADLNFALPLGGLVLLIASRVRKS
jgi:WD40 repeat protein